jgi:hypothetical protein
MKKYCFILLLIFLLNKTSFGQITKIVPSDVNHEIWSEASAKLKLSKKWKAEYTQSVRYSDKVNGYKLGFCEYGLQYKITDGLALKTKGRFIFMPDEPNQFKYYADLSYGFQKKGFPLKIDYRLRAEDSPNTKINPKETAIRNRLGFSYNLSKFADPYVQYELFYSIHGSVVKKFSDYRYYAGIQWSVGKNLGLNTGYFFNQEIQEIHSFTSKGKPKISMPDRLHTLVLELEYNF